MKKQMNKKKKSCSGDWMGYCPFSSLGHDTTDCIVTQQGWVCARERYCRAGACWGGAVGLRHGQQEWRQGRPAHGASGNVRARGLATRVCRDTIVCIMTGA